MGKIKRKSRTKLVKTMDISKPLTLLDFGSENDPCFGKHYDPRTPECNRCGDSEFCAMALGQKNSVLRDKVEKQQNFKDIEEKEIVQEKSSNKAILKTIRLRVRELIKLAGTKGIKLEVIENDVFSTYAKDGFNKGRITKIVKRAIQKSTHIEFNQQNKLIWTK